MLKDLFATDKYAPGSSPIDEDICCGKHEFCKKKDVFTPAFSSTDYYDDEELDIFKDRRSDSYADREVEQFAEIFHTLWESDISGWVSSLRGRGIELPDSLKDEVFLFLEK